MRQQRRRFVAAGGVAGAGLAAAFAGAAPAADPPAAATQAQERGVGGPFSLVMMVHTSSGGFGDLPGVKPWGGARRTGTRFAYRSIPCTGNAPVNNIASDLPSYNTRITGSRAPSSMRAHPFSFRLRRNERTRKWEMAGRITFTVCKLAPGPTPADDPVPDANKPKIRVTFRASYVRMTNESLHFSGTFRIRGGTQRYNDLTGSGELAGYLMCFAPEGCRALGGKYRDGQFTMQGTYRDPTPDLAAG